MNILFISNFYPPNVFGGYERLCFDVASALQDRGHSITVLTSSYGDATSENYGHVVRRELFLFATEGNIYQAYECSAEEKENHERENRRIIKAVVSEVKPNIIFVWNLYFFTPDLLNTIEKLNVRKCYLLTDNWLIAQLNPDFISSYFSNEIFGKPQGNRRFLTTLKRIYSEARLRLNRKPYLLTGKAIFPSNFMKQLYRDAGFGFLDGKTICYHGVKFLHSSGEQRRFRGELCSQNEIRLLFAGRIVNIKGVHTAVSSIRQVKEYLGDNFRVTLTVVGDTQDKAYLGELKDIISSQGIQDSVVFQDKVQEADLFQLFQQHDIYLFPSLYEPFSLTLILALEAGIPTIASDIGGNIEIIENRKTGLLFKSGNSDALARSICCLVDDPHLRERISINASSHASSFTFENMISKIERELQGVEG